MATASTRQALLEAGLHAFDAAGFDQTTVADIRQIAGVSNGSFFHYFKSKEGLGAALFLDALRAYHLAMLDVLEAGPSAAAGVAGLIRAHLEWVMTERQQARLLFELAREDWLRTIDAAQAAENASFGQGLEVWRSPLVESGALRPMAAIVFTSQIIGPAQVFCRAWLAGRTTNDPRQYADSLIECAVRSLVADAHAR